MHRHWFEYIVPQRLSMALLLAITVWMALSLLFAYLLGAFAEEQTEDTANAVGTALFFASINVFSVVAGAWVIRRSAELVSALHLNCDAETRKELSARVSSITTRRAGIILLICLLAGLAHNAFLQDTLLGVFAAVTSSPIALGGALGTMLSWFVVSHIVIAFVQNAHTFATIGERYVEVDLLQPDNHNLIGRAALLPTLGLIGTQALYPLLWLDGNLSLIAALPGFLVTLTSLVYLFIRSTLPLHRRLSRVKEEQLRLINNRIQQLRKGAADDAPAGQQLIELQALLDHRTYLQACPEWPFKVTTVVRWSLYLLIPPLTWVGAALIENVVDLALS